MGHGNVGTSARARARACVDPLPEVNLLNSVRSYDDMI